MAGGSTKAVYTAIVGNGFLTVVKFGGFFVSGSAALLAEGIHSLADVSNQSLLALGIHRSAQPANEEHPYGYSQELFIWALISAVGIFFLGCGLTVYHGVQSLLHPHVVESQWIGLGVLTLSAIVEAWTLYVAWAAVSESAKSLDMSLVQYVREGPDPMGVAVLLEDAAAELGVLIALTCLGLSVWTGDPMWDGLGSLLIGILLGLIALFLIVRNKNALVGRNISREQHRIILELLDADDAVEAVHDVKATVLGAGSFRFKAELDFDGAVVMKHYLAQLSEEERSRLNQELGAGDDGTYGELGESFVTALGLEIDRIESDIRTLLPEAKHLDLEVH
ncbi:MAG: cation diffusion facilitator family transporter [Myxococcota bacterium]|nr:cation diffusion facilitator family transporter [Myxococcota bacterium]